MGLKYTKEIFGIRYKIENNLITRLKIRWKSKKAKKYLTSKLKKI